MKKENNSKEYFMNIALKEANKAKKHDEVPIGAIIEKDGRIIAKAYNKKEIKKCCIAHAEILAIQKASKKLNNWRLEGCNMYVTLQPCPMCKSAIEQARLSNVYYGSIKTENGKNVLYSDNQTSFILIDEKNCSKIISNYFKKKR